MQRAKLLYQLSYGNHNIGGQGLIPAKVEAMAFPLPYLLRSHVRWVHPHRRQSLYANATVTANGLLAATALAFWLMACLIKLSRCRVLL